MTTTTLTRTKTDARTISGEGIQVFLQLMPYVGLLFGFFLIRVHEIDGHLPYFVDELRHISRARIVYHFTDLQISTTPGKFLLYYWLGLFDIPLNEPGWLGRTPVALFSMLGAAGTVALSRALFSRKVALLSLAILMLMPFMLFYERLALSDPLGASLTVLVAWWSLVYIRRPTRNRALILAALLNLMLMAKILSGPMLLLPAMALIFFNRDRVITLSRDTVLQVLKVVRANWSTIRLMLLIVGGTWLLLIVVYKVRYHLDPVETDGIVDGYLFGGVRNMFIDTQTTPDKIWLENLKRVGQIFWYLWGPIWIVCGLIAIPVLWKWSRRQFLYLFVPILAFWAIVMIVAGELSTRYVTLPGHLMIILLAAGLVKLSEHLPRLSSMTVPVPISEHLPRLGSMAVPVSIIVIWMVLQGLPFYTTLTSEPQNLNLPDRDRYEYFANQTGYGLRDALFAVSELPDISDNSDVPVVYGLVRGCAFLPTHIPSNLSIKIECSEYSNWTRVDLPGPRLLYSDMVALTEKYGNLYVLMEILDQGKIIEKYFLKGHLTYVTSFSRPFEGVPINLYILSPSEWHKSGDQPLEDNYSGAN